MIAIVDSGVSNVRSVANMLHRVGVAAEVTADPPRLASASKLILPGVGSFDAGMRALNASGVRDVLDRCSADGVPVLGICLGMQLLSRGSEEGRERGLGWIAADCVRFRFAERRPVPHMGWSSVQPTRPDPLFDAMEPDTRFYFVHSFHVSCREASDVLATADYGVPFVAAVRCRNVWGVQFHPEKSHRFGMALLRRFAAL